MYQSSETLALPKETTNPETYKDKQAVLINDLLQNNAVRLNPKLNGQKADKDWFWNQDLGKYDTTYVVDVSSAEAAISKRFKRIKTVSPANLNLEAQISEYAPQALKQVIKALVDNGIVPPSLAVAAGRLVRPANVIAADQNTSRFCHYDDYFPSRSEDRAQIIIGSRLIEKLLKEYRSILDRHQVGLTEDQLIKLLIRINAGHEYGHAIHRAIELTAFENQPEPKRDYYQIREDLDMDIYQNIAFDIDLDSLLSTEPQQSVFTNKTNSVSERVATGFEDLSLLYALKDLRLEEAQATEIVSDVVNSDKHALSEHKRVIDKIRSNGFTLAVFDGALNDIALRLRDRGKEESSDALSFSMYTSHFLGYFYHLTPREIKELIDKHWTTKIAK